jgi:hypothetical protein
LEDVAGGQRPSVIAVVVLGISKDGHKPGRANRALSAEA